MKNLNVILLALNLGAATTFSLNSCQNENDEVVSAKNDSNLDWRSNSNAAIYPPSAHPFGKSYGEWGQEFSAGPIHL